jgi:hypothetical protein
MKQLRESMPFRRPETEAEEETQRTVMVVAEEWEAGRLPTLAAINAECSGYERNLAMRLTVPGSPDMARLNAMLKWMKIEEAKERRGPRFEIVEHGTRDVGPEELVNIAAGRPDMTPLYLSQREIGEMGYKQMTNWEGKRVWVAPLHQMHNEWVYPPVEVPPGDRRRAREAALMLQYKEYRDKKKKGRGRGES